MIRLAEGAVFLALAVALHLFWFLLHSPSGTTAGGSGGTATVTLAGASAELADLVEDWDESPDETPPPDAVDEAMPMEAPEVEAETDVTARIDATEPPVPVERADAPPIEEAPTATAEISPAPAIETPAAMDAPEIETTLAAPSALAVPRAMQAPPRQALPEVQNDSPPPPEETPPLAKTPQPPPPPPDEPPQAETPPEQTVEVARPAMTAPDVVSHAPTFEDVEVEPPVEEKTPAPSAAPTPRAKPKPPAKPVQVARPKAQPKKERKPKQSAPKPQPAQQAAAPAKSEGGGKATTSSVASGTGGAAEVGAGASKNSANSGANLASLTQAWGGAIRREVERKKPRNTRRSGEVRIALTVGRAGNLLNAKIRRSSGSERLDRAALKAVRAAAPYVAAPGELTNAQYSFVLPITFRR